MVTNINLVSAESEKKTILTGKTTLVISVILILLSLLVFGTVLYFKNQYSAQIAQAESVIQKEKTVISGAAYLELFDFQERLTLLGDVVDNHNYWDSFLRNFSQYIIPEVRLTSLSFSENDNNLIIIGTASNFEVLAREMILLKSYPGADSVEFKGATQAMVSGTGQNGVSFTLNIKTDPSIFKR